MSRYRSAYDDPSGVRYGIPTYLWRCAPEGLATRRQLAAVGLRPGGADPVGQLMWRGRGGRRTAALYALATAVPRRPVTPAVRASCARALAARRVCPDCRRDVGYVLPRALGQCLDCVTGPVAGIAA